MSRRTLIKTAAAASATASSFSAAASAKKADPHPILGDGAARRRTDAAKIRLDASRANLKADLPSQKTNGDDGFADRRASFTKTLPHNAFGEVDPSAYNALLKALGSADPADFEAIPLAPTATRRLANPQGAYKFDLVGRDSHSTFMRPAPVFAGSETAAEMGELYWKALCRDVPFESFSTSPLVAAAVSDLNAFATPVGPRIGGQITPQTIFRGETEGDLAGPYVSQFLVKPIPFGNSTIEQRYDVPAPGDDHMTSLSSWLKIQNGEGPQSLVTGNKRYISDARALGEYVHRDFTFQSYQSAALILLGIPGSFDLGNLYNSASTEGAFVSLGGPDVLDLVAKAGQLALTGAWYQKWLVHRRLRPEVYGGRLHLQMEGVRDYDLPAEIAASDGVLRTRFAHGTSFLPQAFPEGSPTHPSYPAGHATIAGACCTVLKAFFEESMAYPNPQVPDASGQVLMPYTGTLTVGGEIDKLANNISLGRDWAGVHYRSDGVDGLLVGEQQAIRLLQDYSLTYNESFGGFTLTTFGGQRININEGNVTPV
jgi:hypothetical protein